MSAKILDGRKFSSEIRDELKVEMARLKERGIIPGLAGILVGNNPDSATYIGLKRKACNDIGVAEMMCHLPATTTEQNLLANIQRLNENPKAHGIFIQLPLPEHLSEQKALTAILPEKDIDGFHMLNVGKSWMGQRAFVPAAAIAMQEMLSRGGYSTQHKEIVIVNVDNMVGKPLASLLIQDNNKARANVTLCYPDTPDLSSYTRRADILVVSVNKPGFITADMVKQGVILLDFGANQVDDPVTKKRRIIGDVDINTIKEKAEAITPVPGGVGPMLVTILISETIRAAKIAAGLD